MALSDLTPGRSFGNADDLDWFWTIVDATRDADEEVQLERLGARLAALDDRQLVDFIALFESVSASMYSWRLWAAAYAIGGGCSDDGFTDFRSWLIARGRAAVAAAIADPDSLAALAVDPEAASFESFAYLMDEVYEARAGGARLGSLGDRQPGEPRDPDWRFDFDDPAEMRRRLPRLSARYGV